MVAQIKRFYSRAELGMRAPRSASRNITPGQGGVAVHYGGAGPSPAPVTHAAAKAIWLSWQRFHMDGQGWADIAYTAGYDQQGNVYAGRGLGVRTAANGSNMGNDDYYAFVWIGGGAAVPSPAALDALDWLIKYAREKGGAGGRVRPHDVFTGTACPGPLLRPVALLRDRQPIPVPPSAPKPPAPPKPAPAPTGKLVLNGVLDEPTVKRWQQVMGTSVDGKISEPSQLVRKVQAHLRARGYKGKPGQLLVVDGLGIQPNTTRSVGPTYTINALQRYLGTKNDGILSEGGSSAVRALQQRLNAGRF